MGESAAGSARRFRPEGASICDFDPEWLGGYFSRSKMHGHKDADVPVHKLNLGKKDPAKATRRIAE